MKVSAAYVQRPSGTAVRLGQSLGSGGEADVFAVEDDDTLAVKLYKTDDPDRRSKVELMIARAPKTAEGGHNSFAWPAATVFDAQGQFSAFVMPRLSPEANPLFRIYNARPRSAAAPGFTYRYLVRAARNLAEAVASVHAAGHVIGDLNESNVMVEPTALITLVDCDSMQVQGPDRLFMCRVVKTEYRAPELASADLTSSERTDASDVFALGVLICQLLLGGHHPFNGVSHSVTIDPDVSERIRLGQTPWNRQSQVQQPPGAPRLTTLPPALRDTLASCLDSQPPRRPTATQTAAVVRASEAVLRGCDTSRDHQFFGDAGQCPWCLQIHSGLSDPFAGPRGPRTPSNPTRPEIQPSSASARSRAPGQSPIAGSPGTGSYSATTRAGWQCTHADSRGSCGYHRVIGSANCWDHASRGDRDAAQRAATSGAVTFCVALTMAGVPCLNQPSSRLGIPACHKHRTPGMSSLLSTTRAGRATPGTHSTTPRRSAKATSTATSTTTQGCAGSLRTLFLFVGCAYAITTLSKHGVSAWWVIPLAVVAFLYMLGR
jgi:serine/threonine protein kinase